MTAMSRSARRTAIICAAIGVSSCATAPVVAPAQVAGQECVRPPAQDCRDECPREWVTSGGPATEPLTGRNFFIDYPCDLREGEEVTFVLNLHGGGSYGNWQRHYFPIFDYVDSHRLVVVSPNSPARVWRPEDDEYLHNIVNLVYDEFGAENIRAFWLAGHSQGGGTSRRLVCTDFFADKVDGFLSLSGGRVGSQPVGERPATPVPDCDFSFIYTAGEHEAQTQAATDYSEVAERFNCDARVREADVVDTEPGYTYDSTRQDPGTQAWGLLPRPGTAEVYVFPGCDDGRVVADVVRIDKGHTEGLEPHIVETLADMIVSAPGGKAQAG